jgi:hypothetical protein
MSPPSGEAVHNMETVAKPQRTAHRAISNSECMLIANLPSPSLFQASPWTAEGIPTLPQKQPPRILRHARHTFLNVYRRLFLIVFVANFVGLVVVLARSANTSSPPLSNLATATAANITVALIIRQDYVVNFLYRICWCVPLSAPLRIRKLVANVYQYGGIHSGAAVSSVLWFTALSTLLTKEFVKAHLQNVPIMVITYIILGLLLAMVISAYPRFRFISHNTFEIVHRWAGWSILLLFWAELVLFANILSQGSNLSLGGALIQQPSFWFLLISSLHTIYPWLRFHKIHVQSEKLSKHAIRLHFTENIPLFVTLRISDSPLREWHSFACIPRRNGNGGSILVSDAGDWTKQTITNPKPYYYIKGVPVSGVLNMAQIFRKVVIVTTGSGIGPCLGTMQNIPKTPCRVLWSTSNPWQTYGEDICNAVLKVDAKAVIIDTRARGRPDLVQLAYDLYIESGSEAVFCISNPKLTRKVVYGMESRGVPAFGPIWDS